MSRGKDRMRGLRGIAAIVLVLCISLQIPMQAQAYTVYLSDELSHEEGYIIIGESHIVVSATAFYNSVLAGGKVTKLKDISYTYTWDSSVETVNGSPNTFTMQGNLFFVFEGNAETDAAIQTSRQYIYSDGQGNHGKGVEKIHEIMEKNPNIRHWNIISYAGAVSALKGAEAGEYYAESYRNWIMYEFPEANIYFVSHSILTKYYRPSRDAYLFDKVIKKAFPDRYLEYTGFYQARYPQQMRDPEMMPDSIHWNDDTYVTLFSDVIKRIQSGVIELKREMEKERNEKKENKIIYRKRSIM